MNLTEMIEINFTQAKLGGHLSKDVKKSHSAANKRTITELQNTRVHNHTSEQYNTLIKQILVNIVEEYAIYSTYKTERDTMHRELTFTSSHTF